MVKKYHQERLLHVQLPNQVKIIEIKIAEDGVRFFYILGRTVLKRTDLGNKNQYGWNPWGSGPGNNGHWGGNNRFQNGNGFGGGGYGYGGGRGGGRGGGGYWGGPRPKRGRY